MIRIASLFSLCFLAASACSGGSGSGPASAGANTIGAVHVVVDTATGADAFVQVQVVGAVLDRSGGGSTANLLAAPELLTLADPSGEPDALTLRDVPTGDYTSLHLVFAPGSAAALYPSGNVLPVTLAADLVVPFVEAVVHSAQGRSWVEIGHDGTAPPAAAGPMVWAPKVSGRPSGSPLIAAGLQVAAVQAPAVTVQWTTADDAPLQIEFGAGCVFEDESGSGGGRDDFLRTLGRSDDLDVAGDLGHDGRLRARHARRHARGNDGPRLLGRITELRPASQSFLFDVQAEVRRGDRRLLPTPVTVLVLADAARIHWSDTRDLLSFAELQVGQLAKVEWTRRVPGTGGVEEVQAREIEVTSGPGVPMRPQWEGSVQSVEVGMGRIVVVPRHGEPILVQGQAVIQVEVHVDGTTPIERSERSGGGRTAIGLGDIVPIQDRIWWRGTVTGPTSIAAAQVLVRRDD